MEHCPKYDLNPHTKDFRLCALYLEFRCQHQVTWTGLHTGTSSKELDNRLGPRKHDIDNYLVIVNYATTTN